MRRRFLFVALLAVEMGCKSALIMPWDVDGCWEFTVYYDVDDVNKAAWRRIYKKHFVDLADDSKEEYRDRALVRTQQRGILVDQMLRYMADLDTMSTEELSPLDRLVGAASRIELEQVRDELVEYRAGRGAPKSAWFDDVFLPAFISNLVGYGVTTMETDFSGRHLFLLIYAETEDDGYYKDYYCPTWERGSNRRVFEPRRESRAARSVDPGPIYGIRMFLGTPNDQGAAVWHARTEREFDFVLVQELGKVAYVKEKTMGPLEWPFNTMPFLVKLTLHWQERPGFLWGSGPIRDGLGPDVRLGEVHVRKCLEKCLDE